MTDRRVFLSILFAGLATAGAAAAQPFGAPGEPRPYRPIPEPRPELVPSPRRGYAWEPGHWHWDGHRYVWFQGRYIPARANYHQYVPGSWVRRGGGWEWIPAHWQ